MRRNVNSKKFIYLILFVAFFTITSYFFDQMVIRKEDDLRNLKIKLENINVRISNINNVNIDLTSTQEFIGSSQIRLMKLRNFWFKNLLLLTHSEIPYDVKKDIVSNFNSKAKAIWMIKTRFLELYKDTIWTLNSIEKNFENIYGWQQDLFLKYFKTVDGIIYSDYPEVDFKKVFNEIKPLLANKDFDSYAKIMYEKDKFDDAYANFNIQDWADLHKYTYNLINKFDFYYNLVEDDVKYLDKLYEKETEIRNSLIEKITITNSRKNYFILSSIISQIFSLLSLLVLFRMLLLSNKNFK